MCFGISEKVTKKIELWLSTCKITNTVSHQMCMNLHQSHCVCLSLSPDLVLLLWCKADGFCLVSSPLCCLSCLCPQSFFLSVSLFLNSYQSSPLFLFSIPPFSLSLTVFFTLSSPYPWQDDNPLNVCLRMTQTSLCAWCAKRWTLWSLSVFFSFFGSLS